MDLQFFAKKSDNIAGDISKSGISSVGRMDLAGKTHRQTGHTGGFSIWGSEN